MEVIHQPKSGLSRFHAGIVCALLKETVLSNPTPANKQAAREIVEQINEDLKNPVEHIFDPQPSIESAVVRSAKVKMVIPLVGIFRELSLCDSGRAAQSARGMQEKLQEVLLNE